MNEINKKLARINNRALKALNSLDMVVHEDRMFLNEEEGGYLFSWIYGKSIVLVGIPKEAAHVGFPMTYAQIDQYWQDLDVAWFRDFFGKQWDSLMQRPVEETFDELLPSDPIDKDGE